LLVSPIPAEGQVQPEQQVTIGNAGEYNILPTFSSDGNSLFFISARDGFHCLWAQRLDPPTKKPRGESFDLAHFHAASRSLAYVGGGRRRLVSARDKLVFAMADRSGNLWMSESGK
jgi:hypothetical protein